MDPAVHPHLRTTTSRHLTPRAHQPDHRTHDDANSDTPTVEVGQSPAPTSADVSLKIT